ncbi:MAG: hypothetical protein IKM23_06730 [Bacteroidales bacterium]|nr:hypothetical protein [Lentimicrobiaceae bacterium]MBR6775388.1 hypothetical protein [Bacteroidales bacterium]
MKPIGTKVEYSEERVRDLMRVYDMYIASCKYINMAELYKTIVNQPSKRFWVSESRCALVISAIMRGEDVLNTMWPTKKEMFLELYRRVSALQIEYPNKTMIELCTMAIYQKAPKFYISPGTAKVMIVKYRRKWRVEKMRRLRIL